MRRATLIFPLLLIVVVALAQEGSRGPSTRTERDRAVKIAHALEADPLSTSLRDDRDWLLNWIEAVPDVTISICNDPASGNTGYRYQRELMAQKTFSMAAFIIEHSSQKNDALSVEAAGVDGALKAYQSILKKYPKAHSAYWDRLLRKQEEGTLRDYVSDYMLRACGSSQGIA
jgi:carboxypeptidase Q